MTKKIMATLQNCFFHAPLLKRKNNNRTIKSITTTMTIFLFLILMIHIQPSSLLKLHASSSSQSKHHRQQNESTKANKATLLWKDPDILRKAATSKSSTASFFPAATTTTTTPALTHYSYKVRFVQNGEKSRETNSLNAVDSVVFQGSPNEKGRERNSSSDNNDRDDDGRQVSSKPTTAPSTFDPATTYTSTLSWKNNSQKQVRHIRSLKNDTDTPKKAVQYNGGSDGGLGGRRRKNHYDKYHGLQLGDGEKSDIKRENFGEQVESDSSRKEAEAIENFQKAFVNGNEVSVSEALAFAGMDMGILEKFERNPESSAEKEEGKSKDKKNIQGDKQLSPSELGDGNNDIKMQDFQQRLTFSTATTTPTSNIASAARSGYVKESGVAVSTMGSSRKGIRSNTARETDSDETEEEREETVLIKRKEDDDNGGEVDDNHDDRVNVRHEVIFDKSVEGAPEGIDSVENVSSFYSHYSTQKNDKNNNLHEARNQSSRLTFANIADFDKVGSGKSGGGSGDGHVRPDFVESSASAVSTASLQDEVKLYRLVQRLLKESPLIDGHNDLPWNLRKFLHGQLLEFNFTADLRSVSPWSKSAWSHTDIPRLRRGLVGAQFWVAYAPCEAQNLNAVQITLEQIDLIRRLIFRYPEHLTLALSADDIEKAHKAGKIASLIAVEGGHCMGSSISALRSFYELGVRYMTLTHNCNTPWADSARPGHKPEHGGLTEFGRAVVREMNRLGMLVDLSHTSKLTMKDALKVSKAPVIFSHSSAFALCNSSRNVPDDILKELVWNRGIIMVTFYNIYVKCHVEATVRDVADHINYIRGKISIEHIGIGSDFDGINLTPVGLEDVSQMPNLFVELARSPNWSNDELKMVAGRNFLRVFREAENVRDAMQSAGTPASFELIPPRDLGEAARCRLNISSPSSSIH